MRPENVVARAGETKMMTCLYGETGTEVITWDKDMTSIAPGSSCDCVIEENGAYLQFNNISLDDVGRYTCNLQMGAGDFRSCSAVLKLAEAPVISGATSVASGIVPGSSLTLSALVAGDPLPSTLWRHNNQLITADNRITNLTVEEGDGVRVSLTVTNINKEDRGVYSLHAANTAGTEDQEWTVPVVFAEVDSILIENDDSELKLTCSALYYTTTEGEQIEWRRGGLDVTGAVNILDRDGYEFTVTSTLTIDLSSCQGTADTVKCTLRYEGNQLVEVTTSICGESCSPPDLSASVEDCNQLTVTLSGSPGLYTLGYRQVGTSDWTEISITVITSGEVFNNQADLEENTAYDVRVTCPQGTSSSIDFIRSSYKPSVVVGVGTEVVYNSSGTFSTLQWERSSFSDVIAYHITWESDELNFRQTLNVTATQHDWAIKCDVTYTYRVAAINPCGIGPSSHPVEQKCYTVPPAQRVALENYTSVASSSGVALLLSFTISRDYPIKSVRVDVEKQDNNFVAYQTFNYSLPESLYSDGRVCVGGLSEEAHYLVCLRVDYSEVGQDSSCVRTPRVDKTGTETTVEQCQLPTSSQRVTGSDGAQTNQAIPDWGIAVIVVGALLFVALIFCFLGLCFACQTSQSKNVDFGSSSSLNTERGGNVVPTAMHMHNPRTMSPTRSCLKYNRGRGHTWNDHVDTLRQMETDKGTHV
jgi:hypothetical protein